MKKRNLVIASAVTTALGFSGSAVADLSGAVGVSTPVNIGKEIARKVTGQSVVLTESSLGAVSNGTIIIEADNGAKIDAASVAFSGTGLAGSKAISGGVLTITITGQSSVANAAISISGIQIDASGSTVGDTISVSRTGGTSTGATVSNGPFAVAKVVAPSVTVANTGTVPNIKASGTATLSDLKISEAISGAVTGGAAGAVVTLPSGYVFASDSGASASVLSTDNPDEDTTAAQSLTVTAPAAASAAVKGSITFGGITNMTMTAPSGATVGDVNATVTVKLADGTTQTETIKIASVKAAGIVATAVADDSTFATSPTALTSSTWSKTPAGRSGVSVGSVNIAENFGDDLVNTDKLTFTLPAGVTFSDNLATTPGDSNVTADHSTSASGFSTLDVNITATGGSTRGGFILDDLSVNVDGSVAVGEIVMAVSGTVAGKAITAQNVTIGEVIATSVSLAGITTTLPTVGIGGAGSIGKVTITEAAASSLLSNNSTIIFTLAGGATWTGTPTVTVTGTGLAVSAATVNTAKTTATFQVTASSTAKGTVVLDAATSITLKSSVAPGAISVTVSGTAGASGTAEIATASFGTSTAITGVTNITAGTATQSVGNVVFTEAFAGAIAGTKKFRLIAPSGYSWAAAGSGAATSGNIGTIAGPPAVSSTFNTSDTATFTTGAASTSKSVLTISGLKLSAAAGAATGAVVVQVVDGDTAGANTSGILGGNVTLAYTGGLPALAVDNTAVTVVGTGTATATVTGGAGTLTIKTAPDAAVATATIASGVVTVTGVAAGTATVIVQDGSSPTAQEITVTITAVAEATQPTQTSTTLSGATTDATITGGVTKDGKASYDTTFTVADALDILATINVGTADVGTAGTTHVVAVLNGVAYQNDGSAWTVWDGDVATLVAFATKASLAASESVTVASGLTGLAGSFDVYVAYTNSATPAEVIFNSTPISFTVTP